jgi:hypothetical protein
MPLQLPVLDDRSFEQLLAEAKRRIPSHTPEWTNFELESDPGITIVQLFAFLTDALLYRANRVPERNRLKFLQLLGVPLLPAAAAEGVIQVRNERGPVGPLLLDSGVPVAAGATNFLTRDFLNVAPLEARVYYKRRVPEDDPRFEQLKQQYEAVRLAEELAQGVTNPGAGEDVALDFYETAQMPPPTPANPDPVVDLASETTDRALYLALLAPPNVPPDEARQAIAKQTLSIGIVPALSGEVPPLRPVSAGPERGSVPNLVYEIADARRKPEVDEYQRLRLLQQPDSPNQVGVVMVELPGLELLRSWSFDEPLTEGTKGFPPKLEDNEVAARLVTWLRLRLPEQAGGASAGTLNARFTWVGINVARVTQATPVFNELLGVGTGEPDQEAQLANTPVIPSSVLLAIQDENNVYQLWRMTDDLLSARRDEKVFTLDPESGVIRFGGMISARPLPDKIIIANYEYGGGPQGNVAIGEIKNSPDPRLQGGYKIENPIPTWGGTAGESVEQGERNIPLFLRHRDRLVTARDFQDITLRTPGADVGRVEVLQLFQPGNPPNENAPGVVTVMVIPRFDRLQPLWPVPDRLFLREVCDYLDERRLVTTEIYVRGPEYAPVHVSVGVQILGGFFRDLVLQEVQRRLRVYLSSLPPGGPYGLGWPLRKRIVQKDLEAVVTRVPGVELVVDLELGVRNSLNLTDFQIDHLELPQLATLSVVEGLPEPLSSLVNSVATDPAGKKIVPVPVVRKKC